MKKIIVLLLLVSHFSIAQESVTTVFSPDIKYQKVVPGSEIARLGGFHGIARDKKGKAKASLDRAYIAQDQIFLRIKVANRSAISYDIDFIKFFIRDRKTAKRTITQEQEIVPVGEVIANRVSAGQKQYLVFTLNKFTLADDKILCSEIFEKGGGRHLQLQLKDKDLNRAVPFLKARL